VSRPATPDNSAKVVGVRAIMEQITALMDGPEFEGRRERVRVLYACAIGLADSMLRGSVPIGRRISLEATDKLASFMMRQSDASDAPGSSPHIVGPSPHIVGPDLVATPRERPSVRYDYYL